MAASTCSGVAARAEGAESNASNPTAARRKGRKDFTESVRREADKEGVRVKGNLLEEESRLAQRA